MRYRRQNGLFFSTVALFTGALLASSKLPNFVDSRNATCIERDRPTLPAVGPDGVTTVTEQGRLRPGYVWGMFVRGTQSVRVLVARSCARARPGRGRCPRTISYYTRRGHGDVAGRPTIGASRMAASGCVDLLASLHGRERPTGIRRLHGGVCTVT